MADSATIGLVGLTILVIADLIIAGLVPPYVTHKRLKDFLSGKRKDPALESFMVEIERRATIRIVTLGKDQKDMMIRDMEQLLSKATVQIGLDLGKALMVKDKVKAASASAEVRNEKKESRELAKRALAMNPEARGFLPFLEELPLRDQDKLIKAAAYMTPDLFVPPGYTPQGQPVAPVAQEVPTDGVGEM